MNKTVKLSESQKEALIGIGKVESISLLSNPYHKSSISYLEKHGLIKHLADGVRMKITTKGKNHLFGI